MKPSRRKTRPAGKPDRQRRPTDKVRPPPRVAPPSQPPPDEPEPKPAPVPIPSTVTAVVIQQDDNGMRLDRFLEVRYPALAFSHIQRIIRKGELRVEGKRAKPNQRLETGQKLRIPPLKLAVAAAAKSAGTGSVRDRDELRRMTLYEDDDVLVIDKPMGLAVQGGSGTVRHVDGMIDSLPQPNGQRARLVHRLDKDTSGCLLIAKTRFAAQELTKTFRTRSARKIYWALVAGRPLPPQGRISTYIAKDEEAEAEGEAKMRIAEHGEEGAAHALTYYAVVEHAARIASWVSLKPVTGRTHQLRAHMAHIDHPIIGDAKYFDRTRWELPVGMQNRLHLLARRIIVPHPRSRQPIDVTAPLPPHMRQSWSLLGFDLTREDPILDAPED